MNWLTKINFILKISLIAAGAIAGWFALNYLQLNICYFFYYLDHYEELCQNFSHIQALVLRNNTNQISPEDRILLIKAITELTGQLINLQDWLIGNKSIILFAKEDINFMIDNITLKLNLLDNYLTMLNDFNLYVYPLTNIFGVYTKVWILSTTMVSSILLAFILLI